MATDTFELESTLTERYQTTVPAEVRRHLHLKKQDKLRYVPQPDGTVLLMRADAHEQEDDPIVGQFLQLLAHDMKNNPHRIHMVDETWLERARALVSDVDIDLDAPLSPEDD